jgi:hypothetical protein
MKTLLFAGLLAAGSVYGQSGGVIPSNARIFIDANQGFNIFLTAALEKKHVALTVTTDKSRADFALQGFSRRDAGSDDEASVRLVNLKSAEVVFAWSVEKTETVHGMQTAADACAKHLRAAMQKKPQLADNAIKAAAKKLQVWPSRDPALDF